MVRYSLEPEYIHNKEEIYTCDIVFIAVPAPTTRSGFDSSIIRDALSLVPEDKIAVIKSTLLPGTTDTLQESFPSLYILHSPEFLVEKTAAHDAAHPNRNIIGIPKDTDIYRDKAKQVLSVLPRAPYEEVMSARDAEFVKYAGNCLLYTKVIFMNLLYDLVKAEEGDWEKIRDALVHDPRIGTSHTEPVHQTGRGAGGHCFIKDFEAFRNMYDELANDPQGSTLLKAFVEKNIQLLIASNKDIDLLRGVYGITFSI